MEKEILFVVPYRDRTDNYDFFMNNVPQFYKKVNLSFDILISELDNIGDWNAGLCCNSVIDFNNGNVYKYICVTHIDICPVGGEFYFPEKNEFVIEYGDHGSFITEYGNFLDVNGYNNNMWGWGYEDDCIYRRATYKNYNIRTYDEVSNMDFFRMQNHIRKVFEENENNSLKIIEKEYIKYNDGFTITDDGIYNFNEYGKTHSHEKLTDNIYKHHVKPLLKSPRELSKNDSYKIIH